MNSSIKLTVSSFFLFLAAGLLFSSCKKESTNSVNTNGYMNSILLTRTDMRMGVSCAGTFYAKFQTGSGMYSSTEYNIINTFDQMGITASDTFPLAFNVNWVAAGYCGADQINITGYQRR